MPDLETVSTWRGRTMLDRDSGRIGTKASFVPLAQAFQSDHDVLVPYDKQLVMDAPRVDADQHLSEAEERRLWRHYGPRLRPC